MRYLVDFGTVLVALGVMPLVGCSEEEPEEAQPECLTGADCDDQNECTRDECRSEGSSTIKYCQHVVGNVVNCDFNGIDELIEDGLCVDERDPSSHGGVCVKNPCDDDNECTDDLPFDDRCEHIGCTGCHPCDWEGGGDGVCIDGVCEEDPCTSTVCDDSNLCTDDLCWLGECRFEERCHDGNGCTYDICEPETGECNNPPVDGESCCLRTEIIPGFCVPGPCGYRCAEYGLCQDGQCTAQP